MDPITAFFNFVTSLNTAIAKLLDAATPEQKQALIQIYLDQHARAVKLFHLDP